MPKIVTSGLNYIQAQVAGSQAVEITQAVVAYIDGLDHTAVIPDNSTLPAQVLETVDLIKGAISPHSIAYSAVLSDTLGDYAYNWIGLLSDTGELIAVETYPTQEKYKTQAGRVGNTLANNIILQFDNAQSLTSITVPAQSWQFDYTTELNRIEGKADAALANAATADDKAVAAQGTADAALANAATADDKAVAAQGTADTAQATASKAEYITILPLGQYSDGTYTIPNGKKWSDFYRVGAYGGGDNQTFLIYSEVSKEIISLGWQNWSIHCAGYSTASDMTPQSETTFKVNRGGGHNIRQVIGYLK